MVQATVQNFQETQLVVRDGGSGPWVVARLGWIGTITLLDCDFFFPKHFDPYQPYMPNLPRT